MSQLLAEYNLLLLVCKCVENDILYKTILLALTVK